jgi:hypothetical protein
LHSHLLQYLENCKVDNKSFNTREKKDEDDVPTPVPRKVRF